MANVSFTRDEAILALDTLMFSKKSNLSSNSLAVIELSQLLNELPIHPTEKRTANFRNPVGISDQLRGFGYSLRPNNRVRVGSVFLVVYEEYRNCPEQIHAIAEAIKQNREFFKTATFGSEFEGEDFPEGALLYHLHRVLEARDGRKIVPAENCEICHLNLSEVYKPISGNFLQCHLTVPITELNGSKHYKTDDFITVCPNCHAMVHKYRPWVTRDSAGEILF